MASRLSQLGEEKLLAMLVLGLGLLLLLVLLAWRSLEQPGQEPVAAENKRSVWFDKNGLVAAPVASASEQNAAAAVAPPEDEVEPESGLESGPEAAAPPPVLATETVVLDQPSAPKTVEQPDYYIQLASFSNKANAEAMVKKVAPTARQVEASVQTRGAKQLYVVRVPFAGSREQAQRLKDKIASRYGLKPLLINAD